MATAEEETTSQETAVPPPEEVPAEAQQPTHSSQSTTGVEDASSSTAPRQEEESIDQTNDNNNNNDSVPIVEEDHEEDVGAEAPGAAAGSGLLGASSLLGGRRQGPLLAKLSSWGKQANSNAKDFISRSRTTWKNAPVVPVGGILGSALSQPMESAQLEEPSPTRTPRSAPSAGAPNDDHVDGSTPVDGQNTMESDTEKKGGTPEKLLERDGEPNNVLMPPPTTRRRPLSPQSLPTGALRRRGRSSDSMDEEDTSTVSSQNSSTYTESHDGAQSLKTSLRWAAASVVDSVQTYRGRYNPNTPLSPTISSPIPLIKTPSSISQTQRILQSRVADHVNSLMEGLEQHEYIMLLGHGLLGVNLKATFLQNRGVYVDYLVPRGAAAQSQIIRPGDALLRIGDTDVQRSTIYKVPKQIAAAPRPVHLVLATGFVPAHLYQVGHMDVCVALLHQWQEDHKRAEQSTPSRSNVRLSSRETGSPGSQSPGRGEDETGDVNDKVSPSGSRKSATTPNKDDGEDEEENDVVALVHPTSFDSCDAEPRQPVADLPPLSTLFDENHDQYWFHLPPPSTAIREACREDSARRCSDLRVRACDVQMERTTLERSLQYAFLETVLDYRKRSFLERHIKSLNARQENQPPPTALLVMFLELWDFIQYYSLMDQNQRATAVHRIAHTYFLPTKDAQVGLIPPLLDFHSIVGDGSLRELEAVLKHQKPLTANVWRDFIEASLEELARDAFLEFVKSDECARMRGHLRHSAPFWNVPLPDVVKHLCSTEEEIKSSDAHNYAIYVITYLLCRTDNDGIGELIDLDASSGPRTRIEGAASALCAAIFIKGYWLSAVRSGDPEAILMRYQQLWETYLSPSVGSLSMTSLSSKASLSLDSVLETIEALRSHPDATDPERAVALLVDDVLVNRVHQLGNDLLYGYARNEHPKFMVHKFHEWMCQEAAKLLSDENPEIMKPLPSMQPGCIKRLLRKVEFPSSVSTHKPTRLAMDNQSRINSSAECAVVFGNSVGLDVLNTMQNDGADLCRYACHGLLDDSADNVNPLLPEHIPSTLEAYATIPLNKKESMSAYVNNQWISKDGWEVSLIDFVVPRADASSDEGGDGSLYGVSLVLQRLLSSETEEEIDSSVKNVPTQLIGETPGDESSPIYFETVDGSPIRKVKVGKAEVESFNTGLQGRSWRHRISKEVRPGRSVAKVGIALVSQHNVILSMRETLSSILRDFSRKPKGVRERHLICGPLVDFLGNFANDDAASSAIHGLLEPYIRRSTGRWVEGPLSQREEFEKISGNQMVKSLPPIPLAMMFVTALLEQKIVLTSKRRGLLLSSALALKKMLEPLKWCHLIVPRVPANLADDLLQYPAPFILGLPSDEPGVMELVRNLPEEVTLVDLDVGRVILAPSFAHTSELGRSSNEDSAVDLDATTVLRSQVLHLAQSLGTVFGNCTEPSLWACDRPLLVDSFDSKPESSPFERLKVVCSDFIGELLSGTESCCYWIQEHTGPAQSRPDPTVFFDEDHFFHLKNKRSQDSWEPLLGPKPLSRQLSLPLEDFDLVLELFLRCQSMSHYIGTLDKTKMVYSG